MEGRKIKKIITAINNPNLNNKLNEKNNIEIVCKDLQYKDAILDILNENKNVDIVIINYEIPSEINDEELIKKIKEINNNIRIIYILEKINKNIQELFQNNNINEFYLNNEITLNKLIEIICQENYNLNSNEEIKKQLLELKELVYKNKKYNFNNNKIKNNSEKNNNKNNNIYKIIKNINLFIILKNKIINKIYNKKIINKENNINNFEKNKIITIAGPPNVGKTNFIINFYKMIKNKKILIIDFDLNKRDIKLFLGIKKYYKINKKNKNNKFIFNKIKNNYNNFLNKNFNKNLDNFFNKINLENNVDLISIERIIKNNNFDYLELNNFIQDFFEKEKNNYDLIFIDLGSENNSQINNLIFENSDINILLTEGNLIGLNKLKIYLSKFNKINNLKIIINKKDLFSIDNIFIEKILKLEIIGEIKYKKFYSNLINNNFNFYYNFKNNYKKEYEKIFYKLFNN